MLAAILSFAALPGLLAQTAEDTVYVFKADQPDAGYFLPAPPDTASLDYTDDLIQWQWGKTVRPTARGQKASRESLWLPAIMRTVMAEALGLDTISDEATPALSRLLVKAYHTGDQSTAAAKEKYMRARPFVQMGEDTWAQWDTDYLRTNGSYPSGHTAFGFATALVFAEMWPELQDTILRRGIEFGENRIITGAHYQSDVTAGYLCAAASIARAHCNPELEKDILAARREYALLRGLPADYDPTASAGQPQGVRILNAPVDTASYRYLGDLSRLWQAKSLLYTARGEQACLDVDNSFENLAAMLGTLLGIEVSEDGTPAIWQLMVKVRTEQKAATSAVKDTYFRKRPFVQLNETTPLPEYEEKERTESSYVSGHSGLGWALALAFAEVAPDRQDTILKRGYDYGYSRAIVDYHWPSDIDAARLLASALLARLHADADFRDLLAAARAEYLGETTGIEATTTSPSARVSHGQAYDLQGRPATSATRGIVIENGRKQIVK